MLESYLRDPPPGFLLDARSGLTIRRHCSSPADPVSAGFRLRRWEFTGAFAADAAHAGRFTGSFNIPTPAGGYSFIPPSVTTFNVSFYQASDTQILLIQTDNSANVSGYLLQHRLP